jgi:hypothetical protein
MQFQVIYTSTVELMQFIICRKSQMRYTFQRPGRESREERAATLGEAGHNWALEIDLAIESHQQLHCLQVIAICGKLMLLMDEFVCKVLDGVGKNLEGASSLRSDVAAAVDANADCRGYLRWSRNRKPCCGGGCHDSYPQPVHRQGGESFQITKVPLSRS